jgi:hypothetical protein
MLDDTVIQKANRRIGGRDNGSANGTSVYARDPDSNLLEFMIYSHHGVEAEQIISKIDRSSLVERFCFASFMRRTFAELTHDCSEKKGM